MLRDPQAKWRDARGDETQDGRPPNGVFFPQWSRPVHAMHRKTDEQQRSIAGFSDYMILRSGNRGDYGALIEVKFFMSTPDSVFRRIFGEVTADPHRNGAFNWSGGAASVQLLKQVNAVFRLWIPFLIFLFSYGDRSTSLNHPGDS